MSLQIDLERTLETAEGIFIQLNSYKNVPVAIAEILGLAVSLENRNDVDADDITFEHQSNLLLSSSTNNINHHHQQQQQQQENESLLSKNKDEDGIEVLNK